MPRPCPWVPAALFVALGLSGQATAGPEATPAKVAAALRELEAIAVKAQKRSGVPGLAIAVVYQDRVVYLKGFGVGQVGTDQAVTPDTVFPLASVSKPFASTALAALVGADVISWDDPVVQWLPDFRLSDPYTTQKVTLRDLLCHRSGLPTNCGEVLIDLGFSRHYVLSRLRLERPAGPFRAHFAYCNAGLAAAAFAGARAAKKPWEDLIAEKVYRPLRMATATSRVADYRATKDRALRHGRVAGKWTVAAMEADTDVFSPSGGVYCSVRDLTGWMRLHLGGGKFEGEQVIAAGALAETHRPQFLVGPVGPYDALMEAALAGMHRPQGIARIDNESERPGMYGLGWEVYWDAKGREVMKHRGEHNAGACTEVALLPGENLGIAVLCNAFPSGLPEGLRQCFFDLVLEGKLEKDWVEHWEALYDKLPEILRGLAQGETTDYSKPPARPAPALAASAYVGTYQSDYAGTAEVVEKGEGLVLRLGPKKFELPLRHWDRDYFYLESGGTGASFQIGPDGKASQLTLNAINRGGLGVFSRVEKRP
jgi:CubicO group peptidase (beta-lactamase class C family)